jgi:hypothetical protein
MKKYIILKNKKNDIFSLKKIIENNENISEIDYKNIISFIISNNNLNLLDTFLENKNIEIEYDNNFIINFIISTRNQIALNWIINHHDFYPIKYQVEEIKNRCKTFNLSWNSF